ncbi:MAG: phosphatase PAP2 family protein [bacterium]|nr:phosphatase PAP2 family protein [bacterium]
MDIFLFKLLNQVAGINIWSDRLIVFAADYLLYFLILFLLIWALVWKNFWVAAFALVTAVFSRFLVTEIIRFFYDRSRPFEILENVRQLVDHTTGSSFPSGHAAFAFGLAFFVYIHNKKKGICYLIIALLIGLGRVAAGVHYPSDILGGLIVGLVSAWAVRGVYIRLADKNKK